MTRETWTASAAELARWIARGEISSRSVLEAHLLRVDSENGAVNALVTQARERAYAEAEAADRAVARGETLGPLHGVPMTVKDTFDVAGLRTTNGLPWLRNHVAASDADAVSVLRRAGAVIWGKTSVPFASYDWKSRHPHAGPCRNPWNLAYGPGGSSGGSAAALAAGFTPLELGSDVAGSIRQPSHSCGVYGLRTSEGLVSTRGHGRTPGAPAALRSHLSVGPMARHPEDLRLAVGILLQSTAVGQAVGERQLPAVPLSETRIAWTPSFGDVPVCEGTERVLGEAVHRLGATGAEVQRVELPFDLHRVFEVYGLTHGFELSMVLPGPLRNRLAKRILRHVYYPFKYRPSLFTRSLGLGLTASPRAYFHALEARWDLVGQFEDWFRPWHLWVTPVAATPAFPAGAFNRNVRVQGRTVSYGDAAGVYCSPTAALAHPILTVPAGLSAEGLPIGLQFHARRLDDLRLVDWGCEVAEVLPPPQPSPAAQGRVVAASI